MCGRGASWPSSWPQALRPTDRSGILLRSTRSGEARTAEEGTVGDPDFITRKVKLRFDDFARDELDEHARRDGSSAARFVQLAASHFLVELEAARLTTRTPRMPLRPGARACELELRLPAREWGRLQAEAERQKVNLERLLEHATIRFMADLDAGRVTEQLASSLGLRLRPPDR